MGKCAVCGNHYDRTFFVVIKDESHEFDCFECAIAKLAPKCQHCGIQVIGHGVESNRKIFCCASCARKEGERQVSDRHEDLDIERQELYLADAGSEWM